MIKPVILLLWPGTSTSSNTLHAVRLKQILQTLLHPPKIFEANNADEYTLVKFFAFPGPVWISSTKKR